MRASVVDHSRDPSRAVGEGSPNTAATLWRMGDFEVTIETLHGVVGLTDKMRDDLSETTQHSRPLAQIQPPMQDPATTAFVAAASQAGQAHLDSVTRIGQQVRTQGDELRASVEQYATTEQGNHQRLAVAD